MSIFGYVTKKIEVHVTIQSSKQQLKMTDYSITYKTLKSGANDVLFLLIFKDNNFLWIVNKSA